MDFGHDLTEQDFKALEQCFIIKELAESAQIRRVNSVEGAQIVGRNGAGDYSGLVFPYFWPGQESPRAYRLRRDKPDLEHKNGITKEKAKYLSAPGARNQLYLPPGVESTELSNRSIPICITEGEKKVLALSRLRLERKLLPVGLGGVWNWKGTIGKESGPNGERENVKGVIADFDRIKWQDRLTYLAFDANVKTNPSVQIARQQLALELERRKAKVYFVDLPQLEGVNGIDDLLAAWGPKPVLDLFDRAVPASAAFYPPDYWEMLDVAKIEHWNCQPCEPIIEGILARGNLACIAAATQTGKTLFGIYLARMLVQGGSLFGKYQIHPVGKVLYLLLEDPARRIQERILDTDHEFEGSPEPGRFQILVAPGLNISDERMFTYLEELITENSFDVVFIDTYQKATPGISSFDDEKQSLILHSLSNLTRKLGTTLVTNDHFRKTDNRGKKRSLSIDDIKGTGGKTQNADCVILMEREGNQIKFKASSKEWDQEVGILLERSPQGSTEPKFKYIGELESLAEGSKMDGEMNRRKVHDAIPENGEFVSNGYLQKRTRFAAATVLRHLKTLVDEGQVDEFGAGKNKKYGRLINHSEKQGVSDKPVNNEESTR